MVVQINSEQSEQKPKLQLSLCKNEHASLASKWSKQSFQGNSVIFFLLFLSKVTCSPFITGTVSLEHQAHGDGDSEVILGPFLKYFSLFLSCLCSIEKAIVNTLYRPLKRIQTVQLLT